MTMSHLLSLKKNPYTLSCNGNEAVKSTLSAGTHTMYSCRQELIVES